MANPNSTTPLNMNVIQANPDGVQIAPHTDDLIGFFGATPVARAASITAPAGLAPRTRLPTATLLRLRRTRSLRR